MGSLVPTGSTLIHQVCSIAAEAGAIINSFVPISGVVEYDLKHDMSPVTKADKAANDHIVTALKRIQPGAVIVAEESVESMEAIKNVSEPFWLVDPLDGTKEFIAGRDEFTVNIALIVHRKPQLGVIYLPAQDCIYWGENGVGAFRASGGENPIQISTRPIPPAGPTAVGSRSHSNAATEEWLSQQKIRDFQAAGSSLKFCKVAEGSADIYPRFGRTMEWDIAAGHAILAAAGGRIRTITGERLRYGKPGFENPNFLADGG
ncbi:MAG: 3'(2'),5'-bisphosphate nucleotidase [Rhodospirillaceae bacterium]|mgnify:FL=1|nr:3'(2'),5'-bisphosphate nucleotidase [Rhodospirillaceae bacterium]